MPKVKWKDLPPQLRQHLFDRAKEREISMEDLFALEEWRLHSPDVPVRNEVERRVFYAAYDHPRQVILIWNGSRRSHHPFGYKVPKRVGLTRSIDAGPTADFGARPSLLETPAKVGLSENSGRSA